MNEHGGIGSLSFTLTALLTLPLGFATVVCGLGLFAAVSPGFATVVCGLGFVASAGAGGLLGRAWIICR
jgi:hypothetical protein